MNEPMKTGVPGLDEVLCGGLGRNSCALVEGVTGAGKTTLGLQFVRAGAIEHGEAGLVVTFEQFPDQMYEDSLKLGWDLQDLEQKGLLRVICTSPDVFMEQLADAQSPLGELVSELGAQRVVIDSVTHLAQVAPDPTELRRQVYGLRNALRRLSTTAILTKELDSARPRAAPFEEYLVDTVVRLSYEPEAGHQRRRGLEVLKSRGRDHLPGRHGFALTSVGARVFPQRRPQGITGGEALGEAATPPRLSTGVPGLDEMLGGGLIDGWTTLVAGGAGVGKTTLALQFLCRGAAHGERATLITFEERPEKLARLAHGYGLDLPRLISEGRLELWHFDPGAMGSGELVCEIAERIGAHKPRRVALDALTDLDLAYEDPREVARIVRSLTDVFREAESTALLTTEIAELFGQTQITDKHISIIVDGIILLKYLEFEGEVQRAVSVLKMRGSDHEKTIRRFAIGSEGMRVLSRFEGAEGLLGGTPTRTNISLCTYSLSEVDEEVTASILRRFSQLHSHIQTVPMALPYNPDDVYRIITETLSDPNRDLSLAPLCLYWMTDIVASGELEPLDDLLRPERQADFLPEMWEPGLHDGHVYAVPGIAFCGVLLYRRDLLEKYGFEPPKTWDELIEQAKTILAGEQRDDLYGYQFSGWRYEGLTSFFLECLLSNGGRLLDDEGRPALQSDRAIEAARHMYDLVFEHEITPRSIVTLSQGMANWRDFVAGKTIFIARLPNVLQNAEQPDSPVRGKVGIAPPPVGRSGTESVSWLGGWSYAIPRTARSPRAARELIRFLTSPEVQREKAIGGGPLPTLESLYSDAQLLARQPHLPELRALLRRSIRRHEIPNYVAVSRVLQDHLGPMLEGMTEPEQALADAAAGLEALRDGEAG